LFETLSFDPRYVPPDKVLSTGVDDFQLDSFVREDEAEPLPDLNVDMTPLVSPSTEPLPDPFAEFQVDRQNVSELLMPSLDELFKPFDLTSNRPMAGFDELADLTVPHSFDYEDLDTRDQSVVRTLAQAGARSRELIQKAKAEGFSLIEAARTEAQGLVAEARAQAGAEAEVYAEGLRRESEAVLSEAKSCRGEAESLQAAAETERAAAEASRLESEAVLAAAEANRLESEAVLASAKERIAGLDQERLELERERLELERERRETEEAAQGRRRELEAEYQGFRAELDGRREEVLAEALAAGRREGYDQGLAEGRETGLAEGRETGRAEGLAPWREKTALLAGLLERMENLYQDLWRANGPMMIQLAIEAVEVILNKELKSAEDLAVRAFESCIDFLGQAHRVVFQARPQDLPLLEEARAEQRQRLGALVKVTFQADESLGPGDLIMESDVGRLDATVKHRAAQVLEVLKGTFESAQAAVEPTAGPQSSPDDNLVDLEGAEAGGAGLGPVQGSPEDKNFVGLAESAEAVEEVSDLPPEDGRA